MKNTTLNFLKYLLRKLSKLTLWRYRPGIIGITGSVGKTSTKMAIAEILKNDRNLRLGKNSWAFFLAQCNLFISV